MAGGRLLIVEGHADSRGVMARLMRRRGWEVTEAATVAEATAALGPESPDCIVLEPMLPDGDGEQLLRRVRGEGLDIRVVVATAATDPARLAALWSLAPDALLRKPLEFEALARACAGPG